jgi:uncharacterized protein (TIGR02246 family)
VTDLVTADAGIRQLQSRYTDAVWRWDFEAFGDCFTEDAEWRVVGLSAKGRAACVDLLRQVYPNFDRVLFLMITPILDVGDGVATGRTYVTEQNVYKDRRPGFSIGVYFDRFVQEKDGRWRFAYHHFTSHYLGPTDMKGRFFEAPDYGPPPGMPGRDDPATPSAETIFGGG